MKEEERWSASNREEGGLGKEKITVFSKAGMRNQYLLSQSFPVCVVFVNDTPVTDLSGSWGSERFSKWPEVTQLVTKPGF